MTKSQKSPSYTDVPAPFKSGQVKSYPSIQNKTTRRKVSARKEFIEQNRLRLGFERKLRMQIQNVFRDAGKNAEKEFVESGRLIATDRDLEKDTKAVLDGHYRAVIEAFGLRILRDQKQESQFENIIRNYIRDFGAIRVVQISNTTMNQINRVVQQGLQEGLGVAQIGKNIRESTDSPFSRYRANTIARTETHSAASYGNHAINASLNIPNQMKRWVAVADARARATHVAANGTEIPLDEDFIVGGVPMGYTGDPRGGAANVINCRCVTLYVSPEDEVFVDDKPPTQEVRGKLDIASTLSVSSPKIRQQYNEKLNDNLSGLALAAAIKLPKPNTIKKSKRGFYQRETMLISSDLESNTLEHEYGHHVDFIASKKMRYLSQQDKGFQRAFIDDAKSLGLAVEGTDFDDMLGFRLGADTKPKLETLRERFLEKVEKTKIYKRGRRKGMSFQYQAWSPRYDGANSISDIIDAMTKGSFFTDFSAWGHGRNYYKRSGSFYYETFANLFAIHGNKKAMNEARKLFPNLVREFERMLKEIADG